MEEAKAIDYLGRVRAIAAAVLVLAGAMAIVGSFIDWVEITPAGSVLAEFGEEPESRNVSEPFTGLEAGDGWWVLTAGVVMVLAATLLVVRARALYAWLAFLAAIVIGSIAVADFRGIEDISSGLSRRMDVIGDADPALGITLVAAGGVLGMLASVVGIVASPRRVAG